MNHVIQIIARNRLVNGAIFVNPMQSLWGGIQNIRSMSKTAQRRGAIRDKAARAKETPSPDDDRPVDEILRSIDTTLTPRQRMHVEAIKKSYKGGVNSKRCKGKFTFTIYYIFEISI